MAVLLILSVSLTACAPAATPTIVPTATSQPPAKAVTPTVAAPAAATPTAAAPKPTVAPPTATPKPATLRFGHDRTTSRAGVYIAIEKGFFKEQGIDIDINEFRTSTDAVAPLTGGQLDFAGMPLGVAFLNATDRGIPLKIVAGQGQDQPNWAPAWILLRKDLSDSGQVKSWKDLKGQKVGVPSRGSVLEMIIDKALQDEGMTVDDIDLVVLTMPDILVALANKSIAAGATSEPSTTSAVQQGFAVRWTPDYQHFGGKLQSGFVAFGPELAKNKELGQRWAIAYLKGARAYLDAFEKKTDRDEIIKILGKYTSLQDPKMFDVIGLPYLDPNGQMDLRSVGLQYAWYAQRGLYTGKTTFESLMDLSLVDYAAQQLGKR